MRKRQQTQPSDTAVAEAAVAVEAAATPVVVAVAAVAVAVAAAVVAAAVAAVAVEHVAAIPAAAVELSHVPDAAVTSFGPHPCSCSRVRRYQTSLHLVDYSSSASQPRPFVFFSSRISSVISHDMQLDIHPVAGQGQ